MEFLLRPQKTVGGLNFEQGIAGRAVRRVGPRRHTLARPFGCQQSTIASLAGSRAGLHVFVIDNSYSMAYEAGRPDAKTHLEQAKLMSKGLIDRLSAGGESVAIVTASRPAAAVIAAPSYDLEAAKAASTASTRRPAGPTCSARSAAPLRSAAPSPVSLESSSISERRDALGLGIVRGRGDQTARPRARGDLSDHALNLGKPDQSNRATLDVRRRAAR